MEKMLCLIHAGRIVFSFAFIVSAWREYDDERTWLVFNLNGEEAAEEYIILGIVMKAKYIIGLGIMMKLYGGISFLSSTYPGALILLIYQAIVSPVLYDLYNRGYIQFRQSYQHFLQISHRSCEELGLSNARYRKFCDQISEYVNETLSADNGASVAMCHHESIDQELRSQKFCDLVNEVERQANSNPLFTQSKVNTFFMPFIKGFGIIAALVFFITMKHKYGMLKKHKTN
ncbi:hypothetical protein DY000_02041831 [Brassica cretica]|uniref:Uncharacterized protein n=1 Tax=Brassica cretica TaxID=69181 RepID=A0ABQ7BQH3_BRACR|nr:hypothetical protein DY000_02041831 [Brassica cretica]